VCLKPLPAPRQARPGTPYARVESVDDAIPDGQVHGSVHLSGPSPVRADVLVMTRATGVVGVGLPRRAEHGKGGGVASQHVASRCRRAQSVATRTFSGAGAGGGHSHYVRTRTLNAARPPHYQNLFALTLNLTHPVHAEAKPAGPPPPATARAPVTLPSSRRCSPPARDGRCGAPTRCGRRRRWSCCTTGAPWASA